jgi:hypothetical protein
MPQDGLQTYWVASRCRLDRWGRALRRLALVLDGHPQAIQISPHAWSFVEEILSSDPLTRIWTAVSTAHDRTHSLQEAEPIARNILIGHAEARHRALKCLNVGLRWEDPQAMGINRARRQIEFWTDWMLSRLNYMLKRNFADFAIDSKRVSRLCEQAFESNRFGTAEGVPVTATVPLTTAWGSSASFHLPNSDLTYEIAAGILACFDPLLFDATGVLRSLQLACLLAASRDTQISSNELYAEIYEQGTTNMYKSGARRFFHDPNPDRD